MIKKKVAIHVQGEHGNLIVEQNVFIYAYGNLSDYKVGDTLKRQRHDPVVAETIGPSHGTHMFPMIKFKSTTP